MSKKARKRTFISDLLKREICAFRKDNMLLNHTEIAAHFNAKYDLNIDRTTISKIINKKDKWLISTFEYLIDKAKNQSSLNLFGEIT